MKDWINLKKLKENKTIQGELRKVVLEVMGDIENGSVTLIKQDNYVIQINRNEKFTINII